MNSVNLILNGSSDSTPIKTMKNGTPKINDYQLEKMDCNEDSQTTEYIMSPESINGHHKNHLSDGDFGSNGYHNGHTCDELSNGTSIISNNGNEESMGGLLIMINNLFYVFYKYLINVLFKYRN